MSGGDSSAELVCRFRPDTTLTFVNDAYCDYFRCSRDELVGTPFLRHVPECAHGTVRAHVDRMVASKLIDRCEHPVRRHDGAQAWHEWINVPILDAQGRVSEVQSTGRDVTARKRVEVELHAKHAMLQSITDATRSMLEADDMRAAAGTLLRCALEHTESELGFFGVVMEGPSLRVIAHNGLTWNADVGLPFYQDALREYEERGYLEFRNFDTLFGAAITSGEPLLSDDPSKDRRAGGLPAGHPPLNSFMGIPIKSADRVVGLVALANRTRGYTDAERELASTILEFGGLLCDRYRASEHRRELERANAQAEESVRTSAQRFEQLANTIEDVFWLYDCCDHKVVYASPAYERIWGRPAAQLYEDPGDWLGAVVPEDQANVKRAYDIAHNGRFNQTYRIRRPDGQVRWINDRGFPVRDEHGTLVRVAGIAKDITERKLAEARLEDSEALLRSTLDASPAHIAILDGDGVIVSVNRAWREFASANGLRTSNYGIGTSYLDVCDTAVGEDARLARAVARILRDILQGKRPHASLEYACHYLNERRWFELRVSGSAAGGRSVVLVVHGDITKRKLAEEHSQRQRGELAHMGRVAVLGEIATGIAHELNQPLASIMNYMQGALDRLAAGGLSSDELRETLERAHQLAHKSGNIIRRIRRLGRKGEPRHSTTDINTLVLDTLEMLRYELDLVGARVELELASELPMIRVDSVQIQQVLMNLLLNAIAAVRGVNDGTRVVSVSTYKRNGVLVMEITDSGAGFGVHSAEQLFEPFFSTKVQGLGLGLAISRTILDEHRGSVVAERVGNRTVFRVSLPASETGHG